MAYIHAAPGSLGDQVVVEIANNADATSAYLVIPALQDVTINNANDVFTWSQLDNTAKLQVATTSTNSISMNMVVDPDTFFGTSTYSATGTMAVNGLLASSVNKDLVDFKIDLGNGTTDTITGSGYITGLAPTTTADAPVWVTPITITVTGEYTITAGGYTSGTDPS